MKSNGSLKRVICILHKQGGYSRSIAEKTALGTETTPIPAGLPRAIWEKSRIYQI